jgi:predicted Zn finger-like uncharacterized protein
VVVICPKCKVKLKVDEAKVSATGSRFKCPKCGTVLVVKRPTVQPIKTLDRTKVLVAHSNPEVLENASVILQDRGYQVITSSDGIDVMVKALKETPFLVVVEVSLPKIYGFEICKKLKSREETKDMKFILVPSIFDKSKYRREPASLYGADDYIEPQDIPSMLIEKINELMSMPGESSEKARASQTGPASSPATQGRTIEVPAEKKEIHPPPAPGEPRPFAGRDSEAIEKARRLSRTIVNDIYLYNSAKVMESIKNGNFSAVFAAELREGQKLYENRISQEIRSSGNYYEETIKDFIDKKKKELK